VQALWYGLDKLSQMSVVDTRRVELGRTWKQHAYGWWIILCETSLSTFVEQADNSFSGSHD